jgi:3-hydroxyacyl-CoA dehydrogenase / enoyl-CoA hydratase / 3-hydroxybutyryl-CoA epimerase
MSKSDETEQVKSPVSYTLRPDGVALVRYDIDGESVNTLKADFVDAFTSLFDEIDAHPDVRAVVFSSGKSDSFIVGADIRMFDSLASKDDVLAAVERGHRSLAKLRESNKPVVAAVHGKALGGGFEVALACQGRVCSDSPGTMFSFPEVQLGLLPGLSGLQMLAERTNLQTVLDYGLTGKNLRAKKALKLGVVDDVVPEPILIEVAAKRALALAQKQGEKKAPFHLDTEQLTTLALEKNPFGRKVLFGKAREMAKKKTGGHYPAAEAIIDVIESYASDGFAASQKVEARAFAELLLGDVSRNLRTIFFATTALKKDSGVDAEEVVIRSTNRLAVLGAGLMGAGIAQVSIAKGYSVRLKDRDFEALGRGKKYIDDILKSDVKRRRLSKHQRAEQLARLSFTTDYSGMKSCDIVIEAVFEDLDLKQSVLRDVEENCSERTIFASNTSSIPIGKIAAAASRPENVIGMHYFSPVHKMPLLEVIRTKQSSDEAVATAVAVGKQQGKTVIVVGDGVGFYTSRILGPYMNEASYLLSEGVSVEDIDGAMVGFGWPVGPLTLVDEVGIDVAAHVGPIMQAEFGARMSPPATITKLSDDGRKGRKNKRGFYVYDSSEGKKKKGGKEVDSSVYAAMGLEMPRPDHVSAAEIQERCNLQFINEALHCLGEGIVRSPRDGDIGAIFGLGFPPFLGGPFRYVDALGAASVLARIRHFRDLHGARFDPAPVLIELAESGRKFHTS